MAEIFDLRRRDVISSSALPLLLEAAFETPTVAPSILVTERGWAQITDQTALVSACDDVLRAAADKVSFCERRKVFFIVMLKTIFIVSEDFLSPCC